MLENFSLEKSEERDGIEAVFVKADGTLVQSEHMDTYTLQELSS